MSRGALLALVLMIGAAPSAFAQGSAEARGGLGLWYGLGIGGGVGKVGCNVCRGVWHVAPSAQLSFGGTVNPFLRLGLEGNGWLRNDSAFGVRDIMVGVGAVLYWYPRSAAGGYFLKAGLGPFFFRAEDSRVAEGGEPDPPITSTSFGGHLGIGYDLRRGRLAFVPFFNVTASMYGGLSQDNSHLTDAGLSLIQLGVAVRWR